jgi:hypothetical protein
MQTNENKFSAQQSFELIESMIGKAQNKFSNNSFLYLLWGWIILFCSLGHFSMLKFTTIKHAEYIWGLTWLAVIIHLIYTLKYQKKEVVKSYTDDILSYVWMTFGFCMMIVSFVIGRQNNWLLLYPFILMLYGVPTFLSGAIIKFTPLKIGGIFCWILSVIASFISSIYILLLIALAVIVAWIIPGYILKAKFKNNND